MKHPLVKKEWRLARWFMLGFGFIYGMFLLVLANSLYRLRESAIFFSYNNMFFIEEIYRLGRLLLPISFIGIVVLLVAIFSDDKNLKTSKFIASLPFTRKKQYIIKYISGLTSFSLPLIVFALIGLRIRAANIHWINRIYKFSPVGRELMENDSLIRYVQWFFTIWLILLAFYSFLFFIQTIMGQNIIGAIVGGLIWLSPWFLLGSVPLNFELIFKNFESRLYTLFEYNFPFIMFGLPRKEYEHYADLIPRDRNSFISYSTYSYQGLGFYIGLLIVLIIVTYFLGLYFYQKSDLAKNGEIVMYDWVKPILVLGVTVCSGLLLPLLFVIFTQVESASITLVLLLLGGVLGYMASSKTIELSRQN